MCFYPRQRLCRAPPCSPASTAVTRAVSVVRDVVLVLLLPVLPLLCWRSAAALLLLLCCCCSAAAALLLLLCCSCFVQLLCCCVAAAARAVSPGITYDFYVLVCISSCATGLPRLDCCAKGSLGCAWCGTSDTAAAVLPLLLCMGC